MQSVRRRAIIVGFVGTAIFSASSAFGQVQGLKEKDLAIVFETSHQRLISMNTVGNDGQAMFKSSWYQKVLKGFSGTHVGQALELENEATDWKLVSSRIVPCSPLGWAPIHQPETYCWPEMRLVWQPLLGNFDSPIRNGRIYADDRAVHALYDIEGNGALSATEEDAAKALKSKVRSALDAFQGGNFDPLSDSEKSRFFELRTKVMNTYLSDALKLRSRAYSDSEYQGVDVRPEFQNLNTANEFVNQSKGFFAKYAPSKNLKKLTAFSLPEGRQPALIDEWVFLSFRGQNGNIDQENIVLKSTVDGRNLFSFGKDLNASQRRDDEKIYDFDFTSRDGIEIKDNVLLFANDKARLGSKIADSKFISPSTTSCASCHKLNEDRFNLHNLSQLENRLVTISPRVEKDVSNDLNWIRKFK